MSKRKRPLKYRIQDGMGELLMGLLFLLGMIIERVWTFLMLIVKSPMRFKCRIHGDHDWRFYGGGFSPFPGPKYPFVCQRCGCRSTGDWDDLEKKGFKGKARL